MDYASGGAKTGRPPPQASCSDKADTRDNVWHLWTVTIPRQSITGRLLWGTVWRRRDRRWIYKKVIETANWLSRRAAINRITTRLSCSF